jgi:hypothetical protein
MSNFATALRLQFQNHGWRTPLVALHRLWTYQYRRCCGARTFQFRGRTLPYLYHPYILYVERTVEIPIVMDVIGGKFDKEILEVGNVLSSYYDFRHDVVDKYEKAPGVMNQDIVDFKPGKKYDLIVTISTLEHVGWDEQPKEKDKILRAIANLKSLLQESGTLVATVPMGYNPYLDDFIKSGQTGFSEVYFLKRISKDNRWQEATLAEVQNLKFGEPYLCANGLAVGIYTK